MTGSPLPTPPDPDAELFWTPQEVARQLGISTRELVDLRRAGGGPSFFLIGQSVRYAPADVQLWMEDHPAAERIRRRKLAS